MAIVSVGRVKALLGIESDSLDRRIRTLIPVVEHDYVAIRGQAFETDDNDETIYPANSDWTAARMIDWIINGPGPGVASEQVNEYRVQVQGERIGGYPADVVGTIVKTGCYQ